MKYRKEIVINLPALKVIKLLEDPNNFSKWQPELVSYTQMSGQPGKVGAKTELIYQYGKLKVTMIETIMKRDVPKSISNYYEAKRVKNWVHNQFVKLKPSKTKWILETEFKCSGFMKILAFLNSGMFKKETEKSMKLFKEFAESQKLS